MTIKCNKEDKSLADILATLSKKLLELSDYLENGKMTRTNGDIEISSTGAVLDGDLINAATCHIDEFTLVANITIKKIKD